MDSLAVVHIHAVDTAGIGAYPEFVAVDAEGMDVEMRELLARGEIDEVDGIATLQAVQSAVVGCYPDAPTGILTEATDHITLQSSLTSMVLE